MALRSGQALDRCYLATKKWKIKLREGVWQSEVATTPEHGTGPPCFIETLFHALGVKRKQPVLADTRLLSWGVTVRGWGTGYEASAHLPRRPDRPQAQGWVPKEDAVFSSMTVIYSWTQFAGPAQH